MLIIKFLLYFLSVVLPGFFIFRLLPGQEKKISFLNIFLSYGLGIFFITEQLFIWLFIFKRDFGIIGRKFFQKNKSLKFFFKNLN